MKKLIIALLAIPALASCATDPTAEAKGLLETLEFGPDEYGEFQLTGQVDLNPLPLFSTNVSINLRKIKDAPSAAEDSE